jgi:hypothetical protein
VKPADGDRPEDADAVTARSPGLCPESVEHPESTSARASPAMAGFIDAFSFARA